jgi:hypothetical protein
MLAHCLKKEWRLPWRAGASSSGVGVMAKVGPDERVVLPFGRTEE